MARKLGCFRTSAIDDPGRLVGWSLSGGQTPSLATLKLRVGTNADDLDLADPTKRGIASRHWQAAASAGIVLGGTCGVGDASHHPGRTHAAVDIEDVPRHPAALVGGQEGNRLRHFFGLAEAADRQQI